MVDEIERLPGRAASTPRDAAALQKQVKDGLMADRRLENGGVAPWERSRLRKLAAEGRKAQETLRQHGHEPSLPDEVAPPD
ncbi:MAG: hypothetical protein E4G93_05590 [Dehalococcoidia bacterium]|nr:MAG: hypothetical protein E4G93_05590 [Dehalococcoidia bacterium]